MIRFKVVRASHLLLGVSIALLAVALAIAGARVLRMRSVTEVSVQREDSTIVQTDEAAAAFAAANSAPLEIVLGTAHKDEKNDKNQPMDEDEHTDERADGFDVIILPNPDPMPSALESVSDPANPKRILIYHTHTHEAYTPTDDALYVSAEPWRTADTRFSIVRIGEELAHLLRGFGFEVVHDTTDHEPPKLGTAYARSLETVKSHLAEPFDLLIDLHRDAYDEALCPVKAVFTNASNIAPLMMLVGNGEGFDEKPDTEKNLLFAQNVTHRLNDLLPDICRPVLIKTGRYNQHLNTPSALIEVGHNENTLQEALASMPYLARALAEVV